MKLTRILALLVGICCVAGCSSAPVKKQMYYFPALPNEPHLQYIDSYSNLINIKPPSALDKIFGVEELGEGLSNPLYITSNSAGVVYVSDISKNTVSAWDFNKQEVRRLSNSNGEYSSPRGVAVDKEGNIYVGDITNIIAVYDKNENFLRHINVSDKIKCAMQFSIDDERNHLIVPDAKNHKVVVYDLKGNFLFEFGEKGEDEGEFNWPVGTAIDRRNGDILVADSINARVQRFTPEGRFKDSIGHRGDGDDAFHVVKGVSVDSEGNIYITDGRHCRVSVFTNEGVFATLLSDMRKANDTNFYNKNGVIFTGKNFVGENKIYIGVFRMPQGIYVDRTDAIYIVDQENHLFHKYQFLNEPTRKEIMANNKEIVKALTEKFMKENTNAKAQKKLEVETDAPQVQETTSPEEDSE